MDATDLTQPTPRERGDDDRPTSRGRRVKEPAAPSPQSASRLLLRAASAAGREPDAVPSLDPDGVRTAQVGTGLWAAALIMLLPFYGWLDQTGRLWWLWVCFAGLGLGLIGLDICRQRRDRTAMAQDAPRGTAPELRTAPPGGRRRR